MKRRKGTRGAVSVFLVIVLVPCILITSIFVDVSRMQMSRGVAFSAADLSLNSLMSYYDYELSEYYGLMGSCQNIEDYYGVADQYFIRMLNSKDVQADELVLVNDKAKHELWEDVQISDLLLIENKSGDSLTSAVKDANLSNATLMKDQIVEFMKYRAPVVIIADIVNRLNSKDSGIEGLIETDEDQGLVDAKETFYEAEGEFVRAAYNSYRAIMDYHEKASALKVDNEKLKTYESQIKGYRDSYKQIHTVMVKDLHNTGGLKVYKRLAMGTDKYGYDMKTDMVNLGYVRKVVPTPEPTEEPEESEETSPAPDASPTATPEPTPEPTPIYYLDGNKFNSLTTDLKTATDAYEKSVKDFMDACSAYTNNYPGTGDEKSYEIQWWENCIDILTGSNSSSAIHHDTVMKDKADAMMKAYAKLVSVSGCTAGDGLPSNWQSTIDSQKTRVENIQAKYLNADCEDTSIPYVELMELLESISEYQIGLGRIDPAKAKVTVDGNSMAVADAIPEIQSNLKQIRKDVDSLIDLLDLAIDGHSEEQIKEDKIEDKDVIVSLMTLCDLAKKYDSTLTKWENKANSSDTNMADEDKVEIGKVKAGGNQANADCVDPKDLKSNISEAEIKVLKERLEGIRSQLKVIKKAIDDMEYGNMGDIQNQVKNIGSYERLKDNANIAIMDSEIPYTNKALNDYAEKKFNELFKPATGEVITLLDTSNVKYNPKIDPDTKEVETPKVFSYLREKFRNVLPDKLEEKEKEKDEGEKLAKNTANDAKDKGRYHGGGKNIKKDYSKGGKFSFVAEALGSLVTLIDDLAHSRFSSIRDNIYVSTYIMNMFSYATYEAEGVYGLLTDEEKTDLVIPSGSKFYPDKYTDMLKNDKEGGWLSEKGKDTYNKSLTGQMINKANNAAYLAEVEYILFGGSSNEANVKSSYNIIYVIRFALNYISAFANFWPTGKNPTATSISGVSGLISAATMGVIPAPIFKLLFITLFTTFETAKDLDRLEAGFPVEIYKLDDSNWIYALPSKVSGNGVSAITDTFSELGEKKNPGKGIYYSDYMTLFVYLAVASDSSDDDVYKRVGEVIQTNMRELTSDDEYTMKNAQVYFKMEATLRVRPLMMTIPFFNEYDVDLEASNGWNTFKINEVRGYP